jgi:ATP-dependent exoDNAse (exonuclease V) beta subunit
MHKWNKLYDYPKSVRELINSQRHYSIGNSKLPSVTTILDATKSEETKASLAKWRQKVGEVEAERIKNSSTSRGTKMHSIIEGYLLEKNVLDLTDVGAEAHRMAKTIIDKGLPDLEEIQGLECVLHYPDLYAGSSDLVGIYQGRESIIDFKSTSKPKREEYIGDYYLQLVAYAMAHDVIYDTQIEQGVILMCTPDLYFQKFVLNGARFRQYKWEWLRRLDEYYEKRKI